MNKHTSQKLPDCVCFCHTDKKKSVEQFRQEAHWAKELLRVQIDDMKKMREDNAVLRQQIVAQDGSAFREALRRQM